MKPAALLIHYAINVGLLYTLPFETRNIHVDISLLMTEELLKLQWFVGIVYSSNSWRMDPCY